MREKLKPCPFCGRKPMIQSWHGGKATKKKISCSAEYVDECAVVPMVTGETKKEAIKAWNTRSKGE